MPYIQDSTVTSTIPSDHIARNWRHEGAQERTRVQEVEDFDFGDFLDLINPLQHIPLANVAYREISGDEIKPSVQLAGDLLYGAATGNILLSGAVSIAALTYEENNGVEPLTQIAGALFNDDEVQPAAEGTIGEETSEEIYLAAFPKIDSQPIPAEEEIKTAKTTEPITQTEDAPKVSTASYDGGVRIGNKIYTHLNRHTPTKKTASLNQETVSSSASSILNSQNLGQVMQDQAAAKSAGESLPPDLVRDMMIMALDKYKTAGVMNNTVTQP